MIKVCEVCHKEFEAPNKNSRICKECQNKKDLCPICGKEKSIFAKTCSRSCGLKLSKINKSKSILRKEAQNECRNTRTLDKLKDLIDAGIYDDFEEIPVTFEQFITDREYLGNAWLDGNGDLKAFPFWVEQGKKTFPLPMRSPYHTILLEGGTGLGKTSFAVNMVIAYYLYIVICLKDPHEYFDLADQKKITFAFLNIVTKTIAYKNAWGMLHKALLASPWFMRHGAATDGRNPEWYCIDKPVDLLYGCVGGATEICTTDGVIKISEAVNEKIQVKSVDLNTQEIINSSCEVINTRDVNEIYEIELENGEILRCTGDHPLLTSDGKYTLVKDLTENDFLMSL